MFSPAGVNLGRSNHLGFTGKKFLQKKQLLQLYTTEPIC